MVGSKCAVASENLPSRSAVKSSSTRILSLAFAGIDPLTIASNMKIATSRNVRNFAMPARFAYRIFVFNKADASTKKERPGKPGLTHRLNCGLRLVREDHLQLFHNFFFWMSLGDRQFLDEQRTRGVEHLALAERQFLVALEHQQIAQHLGDFQWRSGFDLFGVFAVTTVPGLGIDL